MRAYVCDACGKMYKQYYATAGNGEGNALTVVKIEKDGKMHGRLKLELCPECMNEVWDFIRTDLVNEGAPAYDRVNNKKPEVSKDINNQASDVAE